MKTLIVGGSSKIEKSLIIKNLKTFLKNKIKDGIKFNLIKDNIESLLEKFDINRVILLSAISDPDVCLKKKKYSYELNVQKTKKLIDVLIKKKNLLYLLFFGIYLRWKKRKLFGN